MSILIVKDVQRHTVEVFKATPDQIKAFNEAAYMGVHIMGWEVDSPTQLAGTSLTREELVALHNAHHDNGGRIQAGERSKRQLAYLVYDGLPKYAKPYDLTPSKSDKEYYPTKAMPAPKSVAPKAPTKRLSRDEEWETEPMKLVPLKAEGCTAKLVDALATPGGVTIDDLKKIVPNWQESSITSALHTDVRGKGGYGVKKTRVEGVFRYSLVLPAGVSEPLPHIRKK